MSGSSKTTPNLTLVGAVAGFAVSTSATYGNIRMGAGDDTVSFGTSAKAVTSISNVAVDLGDGVNKLSVYAGTSLAANSLYRFRRGQRRQRHDLRNRGGQADVR